MLRIGCAENVQGEARLRVQSPKAKRRRAVKKSGAALKSVGLGMHVLWQSFDLCLGPSRCRMDVAPLVPHEIQ
jgi:hypothetical protein